MKVVVFGATGMAGHVIAVHLRELGHDVLPVGGRTALEPDAPKVDVTHQQELLEFLSAHADADIIVNCVGILIEASENDPALAAYANGYFPHLLEKATRDTTTRIVHLSTDCVFAGTRAPYRETDPYDGESFYDRSKALGELKNSKDLTFRMSIIGPDLRADGVGLFNWFMAQRGTIRGYTEAIWNGITTIELARGIEAAMHQGLTGLYHLVPEGNISKFDLLNLMKAEFGRDDLVIEADHRPAPDKTLANTRKDFDFSVSPYSQQIREMRQWIDMHREYYPHY
ncbi:sugar nucleotide-binding protein [Arthrobacter sp. 754]|uniref:SDR family oxidoreductase n=1 Tax=Arthrobacter sp. 754 TaxID=3156315 RepID=UPI0033955A8B